MIRYGKISILVIIDIIERNRINVMIFYLIVVQFQRLHQKVSNLPRYLSTNSFTQLFYPSDQTTSYRSQLDLSSVNTFFTPINEPIDNTLSEKLKEMIAPRTIRKS